MRAIVLVILLYGCAKDAACRSGTVLLSLELDATSAQADTLEVTVTQGSTERASVVQHAPGSKSGTLEIDFPSGYPAGQQLTVLVVARLSGVGIGSGRAMPLLGPGCATASIQVTSDQLPDAGIDGGGGEDLSIPPLLPVTVQQAINDVDILFLVDDSTSMAPKQDLLKAQFGALISVLDRFAGIGDDGFTGVARKAHYHIGVVTSDLGVGSLPIPGCAVGGKGARLQPLGQAHAVGCQAPVGANFIDYDQISGTNNLPPGQGLGTTFACMASVGQNGCGLEHQLEATYRALHDCMPDAQGNYPDCTIPENQGFLRNDALLVVVYLTDEDDCSAPPTTDLFQTSTAKYGPLASYRCTQYGLQCVSGDPPTLQLPPLAEAQLTMCQGAPNPNNGGPGKLFELSRYIDFFTKPASEGGVKIDPSYVLLTSIAGPPSPVSSYLGNNGTLLPCPPGSQVGVAQCIVVLTKSCTQGVLSGDPAVRISQVVNTAAHHQETSICDTSYDSALASVGNLIGSQLHNGCLPGLVPDPANPDCTIQEQAVVNGQVTATQIPSCAQGGPPCWHVETNLACPALDDGQGNVQQLALVIDGHSVGTVPAGACAVLLP